MSTTTTKTPQAVLRLALHYLREGQAAVAAYDAEVDAWYRSGEGRPSKYIESEWGGRINVGGHGYAFPHCIHGSSRWTDYDNICGGCEDGFTPDDRRYCLDLAWNRYNRAMTRIDDAASLVGKHHDMPEDLKKALIDWAVSDFPR